MKFKTLLLLVAPLSVCSLTGCNSDSRIRLSFGTYMTTEDAEKADTKLLTYSDLQLMLSENGTWTTENFLVTVANPGGGCICWNIFMPKLKKFIKEYHYNVYQINYSEFFTTDPETGAQKARETFGLSVLRGSTSLAIVEGKKIISQYPDCGIFDNYQAIKAELDKFLKEPNIYFVDREKLDEVTQSEESVLRYIYRNGCGDCQYATPNALLPYANSHEFKAKMYAYDIQDAWDKANIDPKTDQDKEDYQTLKNELELSTKLGNTDFGYGDGVVPTFQYYKEGHLKDMSVYFNDTISLVDDKYVISESYYTEERSAKLHYLDKVETKVLQGMELSEDEVETPYPSYPSYKVWSQKAAAKYHNAFLNAFLDKYSN